MLLPLDAHPGKGGAGEGPGEGQQVPGRDGNEVQAGGEGADAGQHSAPGLAVVELEDLGVVGGRRACTSVWGALLSV